MNNNLVLEMYSDKICKGNFKDFVLSSSITSFNTVAHKHSNNKDMSFDLMVNTCDGASHKLFSISSPVDYGDLTSYNVDEDPDMDTGLFEREFLAKFCSRLAYFINTYNNMPVIPSLPSLVIGIFTNCEFVATWEEEDDEPEHVHIIYKIGPDDIALNVFFGDSPYENMIRFEFSNCGHAA